MIKVLTSGFFSSIQDLGRIGFRGFGVPVSGAMDVYSAMLANRVLGNLDSDAVLEITFGKCKLQFNEPTIICISGAHFNPKLNGNTLRLNEAISVHKNEILTFDTPTYGVRTYLAVKNGFKTDVVFGSRSFYKGITRAASLKKNDMLPITKLSVEKVVTFSSVKNTPQHFETTVIEAYKGPEFEGLTAIQKEKLESLLFTISNENNRMGYRLKELIPNKLESMLTSAVLPGTVQLTPSGKLIILMRDCQVTGGYPRILQLTEGAINRLAQKTTNDTFQFQLKELK